MLLTVTQRGCAEADRDRQQGDCLKPQCRVFPVVQRGKGEGDGAVFAHPLVSASELSWSFCWPSLSSWASQLKAKWPPPVCVSHGR